MRLAVCGMPYSMPTPMSSGIASSRRILAIWPKDSRHARISACGTYLPVLARYARATTSSMSRLSLSCRNEALVP